MIQVNNHPLTNPNGSQFTLTSITQNDNAGAIVVPYLYYRGLTYLGLVTQWREIIQKNTTEFPRGSTSDHSQTEALREFSEESGLYSEQGTLIGYIFPDTGLITNKVAVYCTAMPENVDLNYIHKNENENRLKFHLVSVPVAQNILIKSGCSMSLAAYLLAADKGFLTARG